MWLYTRGFRSPRKLPTMMSSKRNTVQRQLIMSAVKELDIHATAEQVYEHLFQKHPTISRATVFRNLSQLAESGELLNIGSFNGSTRYDHNCHDHYHMACKVCKQIFDIEVEVELSEIFKRLKQPEGFDITGFNMSFSGICWNCKDSAQKP